MCWSEPVSWITFGLGTVFNVGSAVYLCRTSRTRALVLVFWQYSLLMQVAEGIAWHRLEREQPIAGASRALMILNVTQPIVLYIVIMGMRPTVTGIVASTVALIMYVSLLLTSTSELWKLAETVENPSCRHLDLRWWDGARSVQYVLASAIIFGSIRNIGWRLVNLVLFFVLFFAALALYPCGGGSVWCWLTFLAGPILSGCAYALDQYHELRTGLEVCESILWRRIRFADPT